MRKKSPLQNRRGVTLVEMLVAFVLFGIVMGAATSVTLSVQRNQSRQREIVRSEDALRVAQTTIATIMRTSAANPRSMTGSGAPRIEANPLGHGTFDNVRVVSDFNPPDSDVSDMMEDIQLWTASDTLFARWQAGGAATPIAYPIRSVVFEYYNAAGAIIPLAANVNTAVRVRATIVSLRHTRADANTTRTLSIYLRNRS